MRPVRLQELRATFLKLLKPDGSSKMFVSFAEADGIMFLCPKCFVENNGSVGTHSVICWFVGKVPDETNPKPGRWHPFGTGINDLTFGGPGSYSVLLTSGCNWHGFIVNGIAQDDPPGD